jgi:hypothetical protein
MNLPNFLIAGAARAGTTALYYYLKQHPDIAFPDLKEPKYFSSKHLCFPHRGPGDLNIDKFAVRTFESYTDLFLPLRSHKRIGEASPDYLYYYERTPSEIRNVLGDVPIIIILRNPVKRAFSAYSYLVRDGRETLSFKEALHAEDDRLKSNWDFMWAYKRAGLYYEQVAAYLARFSCVKIILQEELKNEPQKVLRELYAFLRVDEDFSADTSIQHNPSGKTTNRLAKFILNRDGRVSSRVRQFLKAHIPMEILARIARRFLAPLELPEEEEAFLADYFREDVVRLEKLIHIDWSSWKEVAV